jgi:hypothetical protein
MSPRLLFDIEVKDLYITASLKGLNVTMTHFVSDSTFCVWHFFVYFALPRLGIQR